MSLFFVSACGRCLQSLYDDVSMSAKCHKKLRLCRQWEKEVCWQYIFWMLHLSHGSLVVRSCGPGGHILQIEYLKSYWEEKCLGTRNPVAIFNIFIPGEDLNLNNPHCLPQCLESGSANQRPVSRWCDQCWVSGLFSLPVSCQCQVCPGHGLWDIYSPGDLDIAQHWPHTSSLLIICCGIRVLFKI